MVKRVADNLRVAIVHYWFVGLGGGERVVEALAEMFPQADLFALVADPDTMSPSLREHRLTTSFLQRIPGSRRWYRHLLPLQPLALEQLDLTGYDLILSSESGPAKGVLSKSSACHICYCHSPMRYLWDMYPQYRRSLSLLTGGVFSLTAHYLRMWDLASASRVDHFVANSRNVAGRIRKHYRREASVIYPPVNVDSGRSSGKIEDYYLVVGRLIDYKRVDIAIQACNRLNRKLRIIGEGDQYKRLRNLAGATVQFLGRLDDHQLMENYSGCRALLFPGEEDFGIVPVEAQSCGRPVIAFGRGGALETVKALNDAELSSPETATGVFFFEQSVDAMVHAIQVFESVEPRFSPSFIRSHVERFNVSRFKAEMQRFIDDSLTRHHGNQIPGGLGGVHPLDYDKESSKVIA
jgi:glycosyltransferase involved in cell wall biosynthesis